MLKFWDKLKRILTKSNLTKSILAKFEQFKNRFDTLFENINAQVFVLDSKKNIIEINSSACNLFGLEKNTVIGNNFDTVVEKHPILTKLFLEIKPKINMEETIETALSEVFQLAF